MKEKQSYKVTLIQLEKILELRTKGLVLRDIASITNLSRQSILNLIKKFNRLVDEYGGKVEIRDYDNTTGKVANKSQ